MRVGLLGGAHDQCRIGVGEAGDVFRHRAVEQLHILWQVAEQAAKLPRRPVVQVGAVQPDVAVLRPPDADQVARQGRLAGSTRSDHAQHLARVQGEADAV